MDCFASVRAIGLLLLKDNDATHQWHRTLENRYKVACVFFDYTKAFDTIPHNSLLNKLHDLQIPNPLLF